MAEQPPDGDLALRKIKALAYKVKRAHRRCQHDNCPSSFGLVVVVVDDGYSVRCERHCEGMKRLPGQWVDSPLHDRFADHRQIEPSAETP